MVERKERTVMVGVFKRKMVPMEHVDFWAKVRGFGRSSGRVKHAWLNEKETVCRSAGKSVPTIESARQYETPMYRRCKRCELLLGIEC